MSLEYPILVSQAASSCLNTRPLSSSPSLQSMRSPSLASRGSEVSADTELPVNPHWPATISSSAHTGDIASR